MLTPQARQVLQERMIKHNPMFSLTARQKSAKSHRGHTPWNKGLTAEQYLAHYPNGVKGGRPKGFLHSTASKQKMSEIRIKMLQDGTVKLGKLTPQHLQLFREKMKKNRQDPVFNQKMTDALNGKSVTKPHQKILSLLKEVGISTKTNLVFKFGNRYGSIDEASIDQKVAIFIDGNYWHNYPKGRRWDKYCTTVLQNLGWKVLRFWESDINSDIEKCRDIINVVFNTAKNE